MKEMDKYKSFFNRNSLFILYGLLTILLCEIIFLFKTGISQYIENFLYADKKYSFGNLIIELMTLKSNNENDILIWFIYFTLFCVGLIFGEIFSREKNTQLFILIVLSLLPPLIFPEFFTPFYFIKFRELNIVYYHIFTLFLITLYIQNLFLKSNCVPDSFESDKTLECNGFIQDSPLLAHQYENEPGKVLIKQICNRLSSTNNIEHSFCVGIEGPRGSGKTSLANSLISNIQETQSEYILVNFKPWLVTDINTIEEELLKLVIQKISDYQINVALNDYWKAFELADSKFLKVFFSLFGMSSNLHKPFENLRELFKKRKQKILIIIDDFDRLDRDQMCAVIKIIKQIMDLPFFQFLLIYDQIIISEQLENKDELEKIITAQFNLPNISNKTIYKFMKAKCEEYLTGKYIFDLDILEIMFSSKQLNTLIKNYRQVIRIINSYILDIDIFYKNNQTIIGKNDLRIKTNIFILNIFKHSKPEIYFGLKSKDGNYITASDKIKYTTSTTWSEELKKQPILFRLIANLFSKYTEPFDFSNLKYYDKYFIFGLDSEDVNIEEVRGELICLKKVFKQKDLFQEKLKDHIQTLASHNKDSEQYIESLINILDEEKLDSKLSETDINELCEVICEIILYNQDPDGVLANYQIAAPLKNLINLLNGKTDSNILKYIYNRFYCDIGSITLQNNDKFLAFLYDYYIEWQQDIQKNKILEEKILNKRKLLEIVKENFTNQYLSSIENFKLIFENDWKIYWRLYNVIKTLDIDISEMNEWIINAIVSNKQDPEYIKVLLNNSIVVYSKREPLRYQLYQSNLASPPNIFYIMDEIIYISKHSIVNVTYSDDDEAQFRSNIRAVNQKLISKIAILSDEHKKVIDCFKDFSERLSYQKYIQYDFGKADVISPYIKEKDEVTLLEKFNVNVKINKSNE